MLDFDGYSLFCFGHHYWRRCLKIYTYIVIMVIVAFNAIVESLINTIFISLSVCSIYSFVSENKYIQFKLKDEVYKSNLYLLCVCVCALYDHNKSRNFQNVNNAKLFHTKLVSSMLINTYYEALRWKNGKQNSSAMLERMLPNQIIEKINVKTVAVCVALLDCCAFVCASEYPLSIIPFHIAMNDELTISFYTKCDMIEFVRRDNVVYSVNAVW